MSATAPPTIGHPAPGPRPAAWDRLVARWRRGPGPSWLLPALAGLLGVGWASSQLGSFQYAVDDAFITFSFSENLAAGDGPLFAADQRVEGYSNFLWVVLVALPLTVAPELSPLLVARWLCLPFALLLSAALWTLVRRLSGSRVAALAALFLLGGTSSLALACLSGLETYAFTALVTAGVGLHLLSRQDSRWAVVAPWLLLAAALTRFDGLLPYLVLGGWEAGRAWRGDRSARRTFLKRWGPPLVVFAAWFAWRWSYYGLPLPSTVYAKSLIPRLLPTRGLQYVLQELAGSGLLFALVPAGLLLAWRRPETRPLLLFLVIDLAYVAAAGGDWMPFGRFVLPVVPLALAVVVLGAAELVAAGRRASLPLAVRVAGWGLLAAGLLGLWLQLDHRWVNDRDEQRKLAAARREQAHVESLQQAAAWLDEVIPPGGRLVTDYAGVFAVDTDAYVIDTWGLCTPEVALRGDTRGINPIYGKTCPACLARLAPEYFHVQQPLIRQATAFRSPVEVVAAVFQYRRISQYIDLKKDYIVGRVRQPATDRAAYFLERRRPGRQYQPHRLSSGRLLEYPFSR